MSHGSSTVPQYIVREINELGGQIGEAHGIPVAELLEAIPAGINKINVDTDIRLAVTRNMRELFEREPELKESSLAGVWQLLDEKREQFDRAPSCRRCTTSSCTAPLPTRRRRSSSPPSRRAQGAVGTLIVQFGSYGKAPLVKIATLDEMAERYAKEGR